MTYTATKLRQIWNKGQNKPGYEPSKWRIDAYGNLIRFSDYGETSQYGWEVDHIVPVARGGSDHIGNLRPLHWEANRQRGSG